MSSVSVALRPTPTTSNSGMQGILYLWSLRRAGFAPVLQDERGRDPFEMTRVISHQNCGDGKRMRRDHHIQFANELAGCDKPMPDFRVEIGRFGVPRQHADNLQKLAYANVKPVARRKALQAI